MNSATHSFDIAMNGSPYPVRFDSGVLNEFQRDHLAMMEIELEKFSNSVFGPTFFGTPCNRLNVIAELLKDALENKNNILVAKYALWMVARYPEISGIKIDADRYEFTSDYYNLASYGEPSIH